MVMKKKQSLMLAVFVLLMATPSISNAMHIMEGFLPAKWAIMWGVISLPFLIVGIRKTN